MKVRFSSWLLGVVFVTAVGSSLGACAVGSTGGATGGDEGGDDSSGDAVTNGPSTTATGTGGASASSSEASVGPGSTTTVSTSVSSTGSGGACAESPCKLTSPQCGCASGEACTIDGTGARLCVTAGTTPIGGDCGTTDCAPGGICLSTSATTDTCGKYCSADSQCTAPGGLCILTLNDSNGTAIPGVTLCTDNCDVSTNTGCATGTSCRFGREQAGQQRIFSTCADGGTGTQGSSCTDNGDCAATYGCFNTGTNVCLKYCKVDSPACPSGLTCVPITIGTDAKEVIIGTTKYGACN